MIHQFKNNQKNITIGHRDGVNNAYVHLTRIDNGQLYVILEDCYQDIEDAALILIEKITFGEYSLQKLSEPYIIVHKINELNSTS